MSSVLLVVEILLPGNNTRVCLRHVPVLPVEECTPPGFLSILIYLFNFYFCILTGCQRVVRVMESIFSLILISLSTMKLDQTFEPSCRRVACFPMPRRAFYHGIFSHRVRSRPPNAIHLYGQTTREVQTLRRNIRPFQNHTWNSMLLKTVF